MSNNFRKICSACKRIFAFEKKTDEHCSECQNILDSQIASKPNYTCKYCKERRYDAAAKWKSFRNICQLCKVKGITDKDVSKAREKYNKDQNATWAERMDKPKIYKGLPLHVLDAIAEKKRLFDEAHAERMIRGKRWE